MLKAFLSFALWLCDKKVQKSTCLLSFVSYFAYYVQLLSLKKMRLYNLLDMNAVADKSLVVDKKLRDAVVAADYNDDGVDVGTGADTKMVIGSLLLVIDMDYSCRHHCFRDCTSLEDWYRNCYCYCSSYGV
jgi:hypothetical protein